MFCLEATTDGKFMIKPPDEVYALSRGTSGSYNVFAARLLGLNYADYLMYCRDIEKAILKGKKGYALPLWKTKTDAKNLLTELNKRWKIWKIKIEKEGLL